MVGVSNDVFLSRLLKAYSLCTFLLYLVIYSLGTRLGVSLLCEAT